MSTNWMTWAASWSESTLRKRHNRKLALHDGFNLPHVIDVVPGNHADDVSYGFFAAFRMHSVVVPQFRWDRLQQRNIRIAEGAEQLQRCLGVTSGIVEGRGP